MPLVCRDVSELLTEYSEGKLGLRRWIGVRWHLVLCPMCQAFLAQLQATRALVAKTPLPTDAAAEAEALARRATPPGA
jgi:anti-sigma factor ChrR (cupin superfamily)